MKPNALSSSQAETTLGAHVLLFPPVYETSVGLKVCVNEEWLHRGTCYLNPAVEMSQFVINYLICSTAELKMPRIKAQASTFVMGFEFPLPTP